MICLLSNLSAAAQEHIDNAVLAKIRAEELIPAFQFIQDPLEYETRTHHTNMDTYDLLSMPDLRQAAIVVASFVCNSAMWTSMMPRKTLPAPTENPFMNR